MHPEAASFPDHQSNRFQDLEVLRDSRLAYPKQEGQAIDAAASGRILAAEYLEEFQPRGVRQRGEQLRLFSYYRGINECVILHFAAP